MKNIKTYLTVVSIFVASASFSQITVNEVVTNPTCFGSGNGSVYLSVAGGTAPYTFLWSTGADSSSIAGLFPGLYTVSISDNGTVVDSVFNYTVTDPSQFSVSINSTDETCFGMCDGMAQAMAVGGNAPYWFVWSNGEVSATANWLCGGVYTVNVTDANACQQIANVTIGAPAPFIVNVSTTADSTGQCIGTANAIVQGGAGGYTYLWSDGQNTTPATGLCEGWINITVVDANGCMAVGNDMIDGCAGSLNITTTAAPDTCGQCVGEISVQVGAGGASPYSYDWSNGMTSSGGVNETAMGFCMGNYIIQVTDSLGCTATDTINVLGQGITSVNTSITQPNCGQPNGVISTSIVGGISPFSYVWSNAATTSNLTGVSAGVYQLTVSDAGGCNFVTSVNVSGLGSPVVTLGPVHPFCFSSCDGMIMATTSGGVPSYSGYSYQWDAATGLQQQSWAVNLCAGVYVLTVTDSLGCSEVVSSTLFEPAPVTVSVNNVTNQSCNLNNGGLGILVNGGTPPYTFLWSDSSTTMNPTGLIAGTYIVTVTDGSGCVGMTSGTVGIDPSLTLTTSSNAANCGSCDGDASVAVSGGVSPYSYTWWPSGAINSTATSLCAGNYSVTVTDGNSCSVDSILTVASGFSGLVGTAVSIDALCNGSADGTATATPGGGVSPYTYLWSPSGQTSQVATGLVAGAYFCTITDNSGCSFVVTSNVGEPAPLVFNATSNAVCGLGLGQINFAVTGGTAPFQSSSDSGMTWFLGSSIDSLPAGFYYVAIQDANLCEAYDSVTVDTVSLSVLHTVYQPSYCGNYGSVYTQVSNGTGPYTLSWSSAPSYTYNSMYNILSPGYYGLTITDVVGCASTSSVVIDNLCAQNLISGNVYDDLSADCINDASENAMFNKTIVAIPGPHYANTNWFGDYDMYLDSGNYTISVIDDENLRDPLCPGSNSYTLNLGANDSIIDNLDFGFQPVISCSDLSVEIWSGNMRPCFSGAYYVGVTNNGTDTAFGAYIEVEIPGEFIISGGNPTPDAQSGNSLIFNVGDLAPYEFTSWIYISGFVDCSVLMGQTMCAEAVAFPNGLCAPVDSTWDKSSVAVEGNCASDSLACFTIYNTGDPVVGDMQGPSDYRIYRNNALVAQGTFQIAGGDSTEICYAAGGNTIRLEADQRPGHPGNSNPNDVIELCGNPNHLLGMVTSLPVDDQDPFVDVYCVITTASYDPNDKKVTPSGITEEYHFIDSLITLEYRIRFQNTGTDTAFNVYLIDTIDDALDALTIKNLSASHTYSFDYLDTNIVQWFYPWILLPDSNVNEPGSHGFINFTIEQRPGNEVGTVIENWAGIYFDFNDPVITDTAFNTVGIPDTFTTISSLPVMYNELAEIKVYPNPFSESTTFEIAGVEGEQVNILLFDLTGKKVSSISGANKVELHRGELTNGIYFYSVSNDAGIIANGKVIIH